MSGFRSPPMALLTPGEIARYLDVHLITVYRWLHAGSLKGNKLGNSWVIYEDDWVSFRDARAEKEYEHG